MSSRGQTAQADFALRRLMRGQNHGPREDSESQMNSGPAQTSKWKKSVPDAPRATAAAARSMRRACHARVARNHDEMSRGDHKIDETVGPQPKNQSL
eukprot:6176316-Pleurochrysis_carterae.AAC.5